MDINIKDLDEMLEKNEEVKHWFNDKTNSAISKGINTYKSKFMKDELPLILDTELKKRNPEITEEQKRIKELELKFQSAENTSKKAQLTSQLIRHAQEKNIPQFLVDVSIGDTLEDSMEKLNTYHKTFNEKLSAEVEKRIETRKGTIRQYDDTIPIDLNNLPKDDPEFYTKNYDRLEEMLSKSQL